MYVFPAMSVGALVEPSPSTLKITPRSGRFPSSSTSKESVVAAKAGRTRSAAQRRIWRPKDLMPSDSTSPQPFKTMPAGRQRSRDTLRPRHSRYPDRLGMRLGIDFGTTRTVVAAVDRGNYPVITFEAGDGGV